MHSSSMKTVHTRLDHLWVQLQRRRAVGLSMAWGRGGKGSRAVAPPLAPPTARSALSQQKRRKSGSSSQTTRKHRKTVGAGCSREACSKKAPGEGCGLRKPNFTLQMGIVFIRDYVGVRMLRNRLRLLPIRRFAGGMALRTGAADVGRGLSLQAIFPSPQRVGFAGIHTCV